MKYSACIEWLFAAEAETFADRIRLAKQHGLDAVEFWRWQGKDLDAIASALSDTGIALTGFLAEPVIALTDPSNRASFLEGLKRSVETARRLGAQTLIAQAGNTIEGHTRDAQRAALTDTLTLAGELMAGSGVRLGVEPLNSLIDHKGYFLTSTAEALDIVEATGRTEIGIVYDIYHSAVMGETTADVVGHRINKVFHVHLADHPGRQEPGTGDVDLRARVEWLIGQGYPGAVGLEFRPTSSSADAVSAVRRSIG